MGVDQSAIASAVGITTSYKDLRVGSAVYCPMRIAVFAQGSTAAAGYATTKLEVTSARQVGNTFGYNSPAYLAIRELLPRSGDGVGSIPVTLYPMADGTTASAGDITPSGTASVSTTVRVRCGGVLSEGFTLDAGAVVVATIIADMVAACNAIMEYPMTAADGTTKIDFTSTWKGASANSIELEVIEDTPSGVSWAITQPVDGATNPTVDAGIAQIGEVWETLVLNCLEVDDTTALDAFKTEGEARWGTLSHKPFICFTGNTDPAVADAYEISEARTSDKINCQLNAPGSPDLPFVVAARQLREVAKVANNNPAHSYDGLRATGLVPGLDSEQWSWTNRNLAMTKGCSTIEVKDSEVCLSDIVTMYAPQGDSMPAYRYVVTIVKVMNCIHNVNIRFQGDEWAGAPLVPDREPTKNRTAKRPKDAIQELKDVIDALADAAIIGDRAAAKQSIAAYINGSNPNRLDCSVTFPVSGNTKIVDIDQAFGFVFGGAA